MPPPCQPWGHARKSAIVRSWGPLFFMTGRSPFRQIIRRTPRPARRPHSGAFGAVLRRRRRRRAIPFCQNRTEQLRKLGSMLIYIVPRPYQSLHGVFIRRGPNQTASQSEPQKRGLLSSSSPRGLGITGKALVMPVAAGESGLRWSAMDLEWHRELVTCPSLLWCRHALRKWPFAVVLPSARI